MSWRAVDAVSKSVERGDTRASLTLFKSLGVLSPVKPGPTNAQELIRQDEIEKQVLGDSEIATDAFASMDTPVQFSAREVAGAVTAQSSR